MLPLAGDVNFQAVGSALLLKADLPSALRGRHLFDETQHDDASEPLASE